MTRRFADPEHVRFLREHTPRPFQSYTVQSWRGESRQLEITGLSIDAAREIARAHAALGETGRVLSEDGDYTEVYASAGSVRTGSHADTTLVTVDQ